MNENDVNFQLYLVSMTSISRLITVTGIECVPIDTIFAQELRGGCQLSYNNVFKIPLISHELFSNENPVCTIHLKNLISLKG